MPQPARLSSLDFSQDPRPFGAFSNCVLSRHLQYPSDEPSHPDSAAAAFGQFCPFGWNSHAQQDESQLSVPFPKFISHQLSFWTFPFDVTKVSLFQMPPAASQLCFDPISSNLLNPPPPPKRSPPLNSQQSSVVRFVV